MFPARRKSLLRSLEYYKKQVKYSLKKPPHNCLIIRQLEKRPIKWLSLFVSAWLSASYEPKFLGYPGCVLHVIWEAFEKSFEWNFFQKSLSRAFPGGCFVVRKITRNNGITVFIIYKLFDAGWKISKQVFVTKID